MTDLRLPAVAAQSPAALLLDPDLAPRSDRYDLPRIDWPFVASPQYPRPITPDEIVTESRSKAYPTPWKEAFDDLDEIARGVELDGPIPGKTTLDASRRLLSELASDGMRAPLVDELPGRGVAIEFPGEGERTRLTFVIQDDGSIAYYELIGGHRWRGRFPGLSSLMSVVWPSSFRRAGLIPRPWSNP